MVNNPDLSTDQNNHDHSFCTNQWAAFIDTEHSTQLSSYVHDNAEERVWQLTS